MSKYKWMGKQEMIKIIKMVMFLYIEQCSWITKQLYQIKETKQKCIHYTGLYTLNLESLSKQ